MHNLNWQAIAIFIGQVYLFMFGLLALLWWFIQHTEGDDDD